MTTFLKNRDMKFSFLLLLACIVGGILIARKR